MIRCCQGCPHRRAGCHSLCPRYRAEREKHLAQAERRRQLRQQEAAALDVLIQAAEREKRRWRR